ncbi:MAG: hypothetical protein ACD_73C00228G0001, partial [uncultured bacterium]
SLFGAPFSFAKLFCFVTHTHMKFFALIIFIFMTFLTNDLLAQTVYMSPTEALKTIFHTSQEIVTEKLQLNESQKAALKKTLGYEIKKDNWTFYIAKTNNKADGFALIDNEIGKTDPITFLTAIDLSGTVKSVEVLVYRETHGSEVHQKTFLKQYESKQLKDPIRVGQDIKNITGATLSSRAISTGVKRDLAIWNLFYGNK